MGEPIFDRLPKAYGRAYYGFWSIALNDNHDRGILTSIHSEPHSNYCVLIVGSKIMLFEYEHIYFRTVESLIPLEVLQDVQRFRSFSAHEIQYVLLFKVSVEQCTALESVAARSLRVGVPATALLQPTSARHQSCDTYAQC